MGKWRNMDVCIMMAIFSGFFSIICFVLNENGEWITGVFFAVLCVMSIVAFQEKMNYLKEIGRLDTKLKESQKRIDEFENSQQSKISQLQSKNSKLIEKNCALEEEILDYQIQIIGSLLKIKPSSAKFLHGLLESCGALNDFFQIQEDDIYRQAFLFDFLDLENFYRRRARPFIERKNLYLSFEDIYTERERFESDIYAHTSIKEKLLALNEELYGEFDLYEDEESE